MSVIMGHAYDDYRKFMDKDSNKDSDMKIRKEQSNNTTYGATYGTTNGTTYGATYGATYETTYGTTYESLGITMPKQGVLENVIVPKKICLELVHLALTTQKMVQFLQHLVPYKQNILFKSNFDKYCEFLSEKIILEKNRMSKKVEKLGKMFSTTWW